MEVTRPLSIRDRMFRMYVVYNPEKIPEIDSILAKFQGRELQVLETMVSKYGPEPDEMRVQEAMRRHRSENQQQQPKPQSLQSPHSDADSLKRRIARLYRFYNPSKLKELDELFRKYPGQEQKILEQCIKKYGPEPTQQMLDAKIIQERSRAVAPPAVPPPTGVAAPIPNSAKTAVPLPTEQRLEAKNLQDRLRLPSEVLRNTPQNRFELAAPPTTHTLATTTLSNDEGKDSNKPPSKPSGRASLIQKLKVESDSDDDIPNLTVPTVEKKVTVEEKLPQSPSRRPVESPKKPFDSGLKKGTLSPPKPDRLPNSISGTATQSPPDEKREAAEEPPKLLREVVNEPRTVEKSSHSHNPKLPSALETEPTSAPAEGRPSERQAVREVTKMKETPVPKSLTAKPSPTRQRRDDGKRPWPPSTPWVGTLERARETSPPVKAAPKRTNSSERRQTGHVTPRRGTSPQLETPHSRLSPRVFVVDRRSFSPNIEQPPPLETVFGVPINRIKSPVVFRRSATPVHHSNEGPKEVVEVSSSGPRPLSSYSTFVIREAGKPSSWARCTTKAHPIFDVEEPGVVVEYIKEVPTGDAVKEQKALSKRLSRPRMYVPRKKGSA